MPGRWRRWYGVPLVFLVALVIARAVLPYVVKYFVNRTLNKIPDYEGYVDDVEMSLWRGGYQLNDVKLSKLSGRVPVPFFSAETVDFSLQWKELFHGSLVGKIHVVRPKLNFVQGPTPQQSQSSVDASWQDRLKDLFPLDINHFQIDAGAVHFRNFYATPKVDVYLDELNVLATNLTNSLAVSKTLVATIDGEGVAMKKGSFGFHLEIDPYAKTPTFKLAATLENLPVVRLNDFLNHYAGVTADRGMLNVFSEMAAAKGGFAGYVKPILKDFHVLGQKKEKESLGRRIKEIVAELIADVLRNRKENQVATKVDFSGRFDDPKANVWSAIGYVLHNAFVEALKPTLEHSVDLNKAARNAAAVPAKKK